MEPLWRFVVSVLALLPLTTGDFTSFHLYNFLNHSVSACADFHGHVCGTIMFPYGTVQKRSERFYKLWAEKLNSRSENDAIMHDIIQARELGKCTFDISAYKLSLMQRCGSAYSCYTEEFNYFYAMRSRSVEKVEDNLSYFSKYADHSQNIPRLLNVTALLVDTLIDSDKFNFEGLVSSYEHLHDRLSIIRSSKWAFDSDEFGVKDHQNIFKVLKVLIGNRLIETPWLRESDVYGLTKLSQFLIILADMSMAIDFDELDSDLSIWTGLNRLVASRYFEHSKRSTGCAQFDVLHPFSTIDFELDNEVKTAEGFKLYIRYSQGIQYNAFYNEQYNSISLLAPMFYPLLGRNSSDTALCALAVPMAHEILHAFTKTSMTNETGASKKEYDCLVAHFHRSCGLWAEGECSSGEQTFEEDGPDVESLRVAYEMLKTGFTEEELKEMEYEDLNITREQAFFYAHGLRYCSGDDAPGESAHSNDSIRLNGMVAMMPEFSDAFGCKPGDAEYSEPSSVCYLFGPHASFDRDNWEENAEEEINPQELSGSGEEAVEEQATGERLEQRASAVAYPAEITEGANAKGAQASIIGQEYHGSGERPTNLE